MSEYKIGTAVQPGATPGSVVVMAVCISHPHIPCRFGISLPASIKDRFVRAVQDGKEWYDAELKVDVHGDKYLTFKRVVWKGSYASRLLRQIGY